MSPAAVQMLDGGFLRRKQTPSPPRGAWPLEVWGRWQMGNLPATGKVLANRMMPMAEERWCFLHSRVCACLCICACECVCVCLCVHALMRARACLGTVCVCAHGHMYVCVHVCVGMCTCVSGSVLCTPEPGASRWRAGSGSALFFFRALRPPPSSPPHRPWGSRSRPSWAQSLPVSCLGHMLEGHGRPARSEP